jgi:tight adherence protein B
MSRLRVDFNSRVILLITTAALALPIALFMTRSIVMASAIATVALALPIEMARLSHARELKSEREAWPIAIDNLISAVGSGVSLNQAITDLAERGPQALTRRFQEIKAMLVSEVPFHEALREGKKLFKTSAADQVLEVLIIARVTGSSNIGSILRTLGEFLRQENAMRAEVEARHGWVRSSASLAAIAPWVLLVILASQPTTRAAFTSPTGIYILMAGVGLTAVAYTWMNLVGRLPEVPRALY